MVAVEALSQQVLPSWAQWMILIGGAALAGRQVWTLVIRPIARIINMVDHVQPVLDELAHEFRPNSGGSLHDVIHRIDDNVSGLDERVRKVEKWVTDLDAQVNPPAETPALVDAIKQALLDEGITIPLDDSGR